MSLATLAIVSLIVAGICLITIAVDLIFHPQQMQIMNLVWPLTALYSGPLGLVLYFKLGRATLKTKAKKPFWESVLTGALHCGSGCTLGDLIAANLLLIFPLTLWGSRLYGEWAADFVLAFFIGIIFQYYAIKPMRNIPAKEALVAALKADTLSLTFWQLGMYGWMAVCDFLLFDHILKASDPVFWLMMQVAMLFGLLTAYPVNWWLIKKGVKEAM